METLEQYYRWYSCSVIYVVNIEQITYSRIEEHDQSQQ